MEQPGITHSADLVADHLYLALILQNVRLLAA